MQLNITRFLPSIISFLLCLVPTLSNSQTFTFTEKNLAYIDRGGHIVVLGDNSPLTKQIRDIPDVYRFEKIALLREKGGADGLIAKDVRGHLFYFGQNETLQKRFDDSYAVDFSVGVAGPIVVAYSNSVKAYSTRHNSEGDSEHMDRLNAELSLIDFFPAEVEVGASGILVLGVSGELFRVPMSDQFPSTYIPPEIQGEVITISRGAGLDFLAILRSGQIASWSDELFHDGVWDVTEGQVFLSLDDALDAEGVGMQRTWILKASGVEKTQCILDDAMDYVNPFSTMDVCILARNATVRDHMGVLCFGGEVYFASYDETQLTPDWFGKVKKKRFSNSVTKRYGFYNVWELDLEVSKPVGRSKLSRMAFEALVKKSYMPFEAWIIWVRSSPEAAVYTSNACADAGLRVSPYRLMEELSAFYSEAELAAAIETNNNESVQNEKKKKSQEESLLGSGSAVVIDAVNGFVVTSAHVVSKEKHMVLLVDGNEYPVSLVAIDDENDLAILRLETIPDGISSLTISIDEKLGDRVYSAGYPHMDVLGSSVKITEGLISATDFLQNVGMYQISCPITNGNSGGALLDESGSLAGITKGGYRPDLNTENVNGAVKSLFILSLAQGIPECNLTLETQDRVIDFQVVGSAVFPLVIYDE